jgi:hypothetical protein
VKSLQISMKIMDKISGLVNIFFGSDEKAWFTLTLATAFLYLNGFPDAAIIVAVYSSIFAYGGMQKYNDTDTSGSDSTSQDLDEMQDMMEDALGMAEDFQEDAEAEKNG